MYTTYAVFTGENHMRWCSTPHLYLAEADAVICRDRWASKDPEEFVRAVVYDANFNVVFEAPTVERV